VQRLEEKCVLVQLIDTCTASVILFVIDSLQILDDDEEEEEET